MEDARIGINMHGNRRLSIRYKTKNYESPNQPKGIYEKDR